MPRIEVRCSDQEQAAWRSKAEAAGLTLSEMVRAALYDARLPDRAAAGELKELTRQVARIGSNLNQIAAWANTYKSSGDAVQIISHLSVIERELENVYQGISQG